jgi:hypothetical protein
MFKFALYDQNENDREYSFPLNVSSLDAFDEWLETQEYVYSQDGRRWRGNHYEEFVMEVESEYGVLDGGGTDDSEDFSSYEIAPEQFPEVLEKFRQYFIKEGLA